ncbi:MAG TPA: glycosyltransferase family 87 protein [Chthoniobacterales bacterium]|nr:glycosyltransferase family 87 protein [Chthoniobacterales bacterium]
MQPSICAAVILLVVGAAVAHQIKQFSEGELGDFLHFYRAAGAMRRGEDIYIAAEGRYLYPPFLAFILQPLTFLSAPIAATVWTLISVTLICAAAFIAAKEAAVRWLPGGTAADPALPWGIAASAIVLGADKIYAVVRLGQTDGVMLLGFACALRWMQRKPWLAGFAIGASGNIKYLTLICLPYFLLKRNYNATCSAALAFAGLVLLPIIEVGPEKILQYAATSLGGLVRLVTVSAQRVHIFEVSWDRSISLTSAVARMSRAANLSGVSTAICLLLLLIAILTVLIWISRRHGIRLFHAARDESEVGTAAVMHLEWAILVFVAVAFSPQATARHMILLMLIYTVGLAILHFHGTTRQRVFLGAALALVVASLSLPFWVIGLASQRGNWRANGGASWCALFFVLVLVSIGARAISHIRAAHTLTPVGILSGASGGRHAVPKGNRSPLGESDSHRETPVSH